jgi:hypothetical protein
MAQRDDRELNRPISGPSKGDFIVPPEIEDRDVVKWMKRHGITIPWIDSQKHQRRYLPDFLVEYQDGRKAVIEVKDPSRIDSDDVQRKRKSAEMLCKQRKMEYVLATIG